MLPSFKPKKDSKIIDCLKDMLVYTTIFAADDRTYMYIYFESFEQILLSFSVQ